MKIKLKKMICQVMVITILIVLCRENIYAENNTEEEIVEYLDDCEIIDTDHYTGNMGDSFVDVIGKNVNTRGNTDIDGNVYEHGIEAWIARWNFTEEISFASATFDVCDFTGTLSGKCVLIGSYNTTNFDTTVYFYGDDILLASYELKPDTIPFSIDISMEDVKKLKIYVQDNIGVAGGTSFGFVNMILNRSTEQPVKFTIGRDNNIFGNTSQDFFGNDGDDRNNYSISFPNYREALYSDQNVNYCNLLQKKELEKWEGSCYGISASVMYGYYGGIDLNKYINKNLEDAGCYYSNIYFPLNNQDTKDMIQVFQLSQYRSDMSYTNTVKNNLIYKILGGGKKFTTVLSEIVNEAKESNFLKPFLLCVKYKEAGHALLICGIEEETDEYYKIAVCDPNGEIKKDDVGKIITNHFLYNYLMIKKDLSEFHMENTLGQWIYPNKIDSESFIELSYCTYNDAYSKKNKRMSDCEVVIDVCSPFYMTTDAGTYLSYDGETFDGNIQIEDSLFTVNSGENGCSSLIIRMNNVNAVEFTNFTDDIEVDCLFDNDEYTNVSGKDIEKISFEDDKGVVIEGTDATYRMCIGAKDSNHTLIEANGKVDDKVVYQYKDSNISVEGIDSQSDIKINKIINGGYEELNKENDPTIIFEDQADDPNNSDNPNNNGKDQNDQNSGNNDNHENSGNNGNQTSCNSGSNNGEISTSNETGTNGNVSQTEEESKIAKENTITYTVTAGDTLYKIAQKMYGDRKFWKKIYVDNKDVLKNPNRIYIGQKLTIYFDADTTQQQNETGNTLSANSYMIKPGDTLWKIAQKVYKKGYYWKNIYEANRKTIKSPEKIRVGQVIQLP